VSYFLARYAGVLSAAGLAELLGHFLGLSYGFLVLVLAFIWAGISSSSASSKASSTEARLNTTVAQVGVASVNANTAISNAATAQSTANTANTNANSAQTTANAAQTTANAAMPKAGGTFSGVVHFGSSIDANGGTLTINDNVHVNTHSLTVDSDLTTHGNMVADGQYKGAGGGALSTVQINATGVTSSGSITANSNVTAHGNVFSDGDTYANSHHMAPQSEPGGWPITTSSGVLNTSERTLLNNTIAALHTGGFLY